MGVQIYYDLIEEGDFSEFKGIYNYGDFDRLHSYREGILNERKREGLVII